MNKWSEQFSIPFPACKMCGQCCRCASPSIPTSELIEQAQNGDIYAKDFLRIFEPYESIEQARKINPAVVEKSINLCNDPNSKISANNVVFYHCKFVSNENKCTIHEDRPQFCRDYPDSPFLVFASGCTYEPWSKECKKEYKNLKNELEIVKKQQQFVENYKIQNNLLKKYALLKRISNPDYNFIAILPQLSIVSPKSSWLKGLNLILIAFIVITLFFCNANAQASSSPVKFAFMPDLHISFKKDNDWILYNESLVIFQDALKTLKAKDNIDFILFGGDLVHNEDKKLTNLPVFIDLMIDYNIPYYVILGDREANLDQDFSKKDVTVEFRNNGFKDKNKTYWTFTQKKILFIGLDTTIINKFDGKIDKEQLLWLQDTLCKNKNQHTVILMHHPAVINYKKIHPEKDFILSNAKKFMDVVKTNPQIKLVLSGHHHINSTSKINQTLFITSPSIVTYPNFYKVITIYNDRVEIENQPISFKQIIKKAKNKLIKSEYALKYDATKPKSILSFQEGTKYSKKKKYYFNKK